MRHEMTPVFRPCSHHSTLVFELDKDGTYLGIWTTDDTLLAAPRNDSWANDRREDRRGGRPRFTRIIPVLVNRSLGDCDTACPAGTGGSRDGSLLFAGRRGVRRSVCLLVRDITVQRLAEQSAPPDSEERFDLFDQAPIGCLCLDADGHIMDANHLCARSSGGPCRSSTAACRPTSSTGPTELTTTPAGVKAEDKADHSLARPGRRPRQVRRPHGSVRVVKVNGVVVNVKWLAHRSGYRGGDYGRAPLGRGAAPARVVALGQLGDRARDKRRPSPYPTTLHF